MRTMRRALFAAIAVWVSPFANAAITDTPLPWTSFTLEPYTIAGVPIRDPEGGKANDPSNGGASFNASTEVASGYTGANGSASNCNPALATTTCGPETSAFFQYYEPDGCPGSVCPALDGDEYLVFRMRVESSPANGWDNEHWNILLDIDGDGYKEFWVDVDGRDDLIHVYYENLNRQDLSISPDPSSLIVEEYIACVLSTPANPCAFSHTRVIAATNDFVGSDTDDAFVDVQIPVAAFDNLAGVQQITETTSVRLIYSTSNSATDPVQKDFSAPCTTPPSGLCNFGDTTPVSLSHVALTRQGKNVRVDFGTVMETGHAGFDLQALQNGGWVTLRSFPAQPGDAPNIARRYTASIKTGSNGPFRLIERDANNKTRAHGPYRLDKLYGSREKMHVAADWAVVAQALQASEPPQSVREKRHVGPSTVLAEVVVPRPGLYRIDLSDLAALGVDLATLNANELAMERAEQTVPTYLSAQGNALSAQDFVEFFADYQPTLYSDEARFLLVANHNHAHRLRQDGQPVRANLRGPKQYRASKKVERNNAYSFGSPVPNDPWYETAILSYGSPASYTGTFHLDQIAPAAGSADLTLTLWGGASLDVPNDHHALLTVNGIRVGETTFDGITIDRKTFQLPAGLLQTGVNQFRLDVPGDTGGPYDLINLESLQISYDSPLLAEGNRLEFVGNDEFFEVGAINGSEVSVYRQDNGAWLRLNTDVRCSPVALAQCQVRFNGHQGETRYALAALGEMRKLRLSKPLLPVDIESGQAEYLMIAHPSLMATAERLKLHRSGAAGGVHIVSTEQIYRQFGSGMIDAGAIANYIAFAKAERGTRYVLLIGADSFDYKAYLGNGSVSLLPSRYVALDSLSRFIPSDAALADIDGDLFADLAIGRLPARTAFELDAMIDKIVRADNQQRQKRAVFVGDRGAFSDKAEAMSAALASDWQSTALKLNGSDREKLRAALFNQLGSGTDLLTYYGHSAPSLWSFENLLNVNDSKVVSVRPYVAVQFGCWNNYHVDARFETLARTLMAEPNAALAMIGATGLADELSEYAFAPALLDRVASGQRLGDALNEAKRVFATDSAMPRDILLGFNLLGDPMSRVVP